MLVILVNGEINLFNGFSLRKDCAFGQKFKSLQFCLSSLILAEARSSPPHAPRQLLLHRILAQAEQITMRLGRRKVSISLYSSLSEDFRFYHYQAPVFNKLQEVLLEVVQLKSAQAAENDERPLYRNRRGRKKKKECDSYVLCKKFCQCLQFLFLNEVKIKIKLVGKK